MGRAAVLRERNNVECISCGSILTRCRGGGRSEEGHRLRRRVCQECSQIFTTVEVPVLYRDGSPVPLSALDGEIRWLNVESMRRRRGYQGGMGGRQPYERGASLRVSVSVSEPKRGERAA